MHDGMERIRQTAPSFPTMVPSGQEIISSLVAEGETYCSRFSQQRTEGCMFVTLLVGRVKVIIMISLTNGIYNV